MCITLSDLQITLPSDKTWRTVNYFKLVDKQRSLNQIKKEAAERREAGEGDALPVVPVEKPSTLGKTVDRDMIIRSKRQGVDKIELGLRCHMSQISKDTVWTPNELIMGSLMLLHESMVGNRNDTSSSSGQTTPAVCFTGERSMRRVFTLIYDVFRYKNILTEVLNSVGFFEKHPEYKNEHCLVWLLCYDLLKRNFKPRDEKNLMEDERLKGTQVKTLDDCLWGYRVHLGASLARIRIKNKAIHLSNLLPIHLQDDKLGNTLSPFVSGWINYNKSDLATVTRVLNEVGFRHLSEGEDALADETFRMDHLLPLYIYIKPIDKYSFEDTLLAKENHIVIQDRSFCVGAAMVQNIAKDLDVRGAIAQTHVNSIRTTSYLANLLAIDDRKEKLLVFGCDSKSQEYNDYLSRLGIKNVELHSNSFSGLCSDPGNVLENVVGVLATPPNTYYGVVDPVDLVCSRGGDLELLKNLTGGHPQEAEGEELQRINELLQEQQRTLLVAMTKPQFEKENREMVTRLLNELNAYANEKFGENEKRKVEAKAAEEEEKLKAELALQNSDQESTAGGTKSPTANEDKSLDKNGNSENETPEKEEKQSPERLVAENTAPDCDLFEFGMIPDLCTEHESCWKMDDFGLFIAFIKRKEIISLDPQYMIKFAEQRGLFSQVEAMKRQSTIPKRKAENEKSSSETQMEHERASSTTLQNLMKQQLNRIAAPTQSSILHSATTSLQGKETICERYSSHSNAYAFTQSDGELTTAVSSTAAWATPTFLYLNDAKRWWKVVIKHVLRKLRNSRLGGFITGGQRRAKDVPLKLVRTKELFRKMSMSTKLNRFPYPLAINSIEFENKAEYLRDNFSSCFNLNLTVSRETSVGPFQRSLPIRHSI